MPKSHRDLLKRKVGYILGNLDRAMEFALEVRGEFLQALDVDPESDTLEQQLLDMAVDNKHALIAYLTQASLRAALASQELIKQAAKEAWGSVPDNVELWRNQGKDIHRQKVR